MTLLRRAGRPAPPTLVVEVPEATGVDAPEQWAALARSVLAAEGVDGPAELALSFVDETAMAELNERWMGHSGPTDVLSWAIDPPVPAGRAAPGGEPVLLGDVVVCPAVARRAVAGTDRPVEDELALLVVHGVLHVLGFDHAEAADEAAMQSRERELLTRFHDGRWTRTS
jgi:probable rRNA maturation factor